MKPDFIIGGTQKGGTTSLYYYLDEHPEICLSSKKEVHFFDQNFEKGYMWYEKFFEECGPEKKTGEATPYYMFHPLAAQRIHQTLPEVKLIFILRDPASRAWSHYWHEVLKGRETHSFEKALELEESRMAESISSHQNKSYRSRGEYVSQLKPYLELFGKDRILVVFSEELKADPELILKKIFMFLNVDPEFSSSRIHEKLKYEGRTPKSKKINALIQTGLLRHLPFLKGINNMLNFVSRSEKMNPETKKALDAYYKPFNEELAELLDRKSVWI